MKTMKTTAADCRARALREYALAEERRSADDAAGARRARARARYWMARATADNDNETTTAQRTTEGCPNRAARLKSLGNAVVPQCAEVVGWVIRGLQAD
jgi:hypothetical protein